MTARRRLAPALILRKRPAGTGGGTRISAGPAKRPAPRDRGIFSPDEIGDSESTAAEATHTDSQRARWFGLAESAKRRFSRLCP